MEPTQTSRKRTKLLYYIERIVIAVVGILILWGIISVIAGWFMLKGVFLDNNQIYYGKGVWLPFTKTITLHHAYYLKSGEAGQDKSSFIVTPVTRDLQMPKDSIQIVKDHILYIETLRSDSLLGKAIKEQENKK